MSSLRKIIVIVPKARQVFGYSVDLRKNVHRGIIDNLFNDNLFIDETFHSCSELSGVYESTGFLKITVCNLIRKFITKIHNTRERLINGSSAGVSDEASTCQAGIVP